MNRFRAGCINAVAADLDYPLYQRLEPALNFRRILLTLFGVWLTQCSYDPAPRYVGVYGILNPDSKYQTVIVGEAFAEDDAEGFIPGLNPLYLSGATVIVSGNGQSVRFWEVESGYYVDTNRTLQIVPGQTYELLVVTADGRRVDARTTVPLPPVETAGYDTVSINWMTDTLGLQYGYTRLLLESSPVTFQWQHTGEAYAFSIGGDSSTLIDESEQTVETNFLNVLMVVSREILFLPQLRIFDEGGQPQGELWSIGGITPSPTSSLLILTQQTVTAYDEAAANGILFRGSNLSSGYGYFGSLSFYRKDIVVRVRNRFK